jgi:hypothetical protein
MLVISRDAVCVGCISLTQKKMLIQQLVKTGIFVDDHFDFFSKPYNFGIKILHNVFILMIQIFC